MLILNRRDNSCVIFIYSPNLKRIKLLSEDKNPNLLVQSADLRSGE